MTEFQYNSTNQTTIVYDENGKQIRRPALSFGKVFLWLGIGLLLTGILAFSIPEIFLHINVDPEILAKIYLGMIIGSVIVLLPCSIMMIFFQSKVKPLAIMITYFIYVIAMGVLLSAIFLFVLAVEESGALWTISLSFLITSGIFMLMGLIGILVKKLNAIIPLVIALAVGILVLSLVNFFLQVSMIYWIIDFVSFGLILLVTALDIHNIKRIIDKAGDLPNATSLAIYCAYSLYVDFIYIFIKVLFYVLIARRR